MNRMLGYLKGYERESVLAPLFKMLEATFDLFVPLVMRVMRVLVPSVSISEKLRLWIWANRACRSAVE